MSNALDTLRAPASAAPTNFPAMLKAYSSEIARALPKHMSGDRLARIALTEFRKNPKLGQCDPKSVFASVIMASQLGLEPGILGQCYLVPYGSECQFIPGWQGIVELINRTGRATAWTGAVFNDAIQFEYEFGDKPFIKHIPGDEDEPDLMTHAYAVGRVNGAEWPVIDVWSMKKVFKHRNKYNKVGNRHYSYKHPEMYSRKVVLLQIVKYMPKSVELAAAVAAENASYTGQPINNPLEVIEGTYFPITEDPDDAPEQPVAVPAETAPPVADSLLPKEPKK